MGTFEELSKSEGGFARIVASLSSINQKHEVEELEAAKEDIDGDITSDGEKQEKYAEKIDEARSKFLQEEERIRGSAPASVYKSFFLKTGGGVMMNLALLLLLASATGSYLMVNYWLVFWRKQTFDRPTGFYVSFA